MSDIEDYSYSPYDDLEDILYDADPAPELADDLAEHALHSPVYLDEIAGYELQEYFSDWDYYSDDYMDDDPTLEKGEYTGHVGTVKRGKKRKLVETKDIPALDLNETRLITRSIKGIVWAKPGNTGPPIHTVGQGDAISLLKDWKQVFSIEDDGWGRKANASDNDESWAKDMSLADMGLQPLQSQKSFEQEPEQGEEESEEDRNEDEEGVEEEEVEIIDDARDLADIQFTLQDHESHASGGDGGDGEGARSATKRRASTLSQVMNAANAQSSDASEDENPRKRRRYKPELPSPPNSSESVALDMGDDQAGVQSRAQPIASVTTGLGGSSPARTNRKRKASEEPPTEEVGITRSTAGGRSKRVAATSINRTVSNRPSETISRPTRHSKQK